jgi:hypothetical protein
MSTKEQVPLVVPRRTIARATAAALLSAVVILAVAVLPAEYGMDPTGLGKRIGFTRLYAEKLPQAPTRHRSEAAKFQSNSIEIPLGPKQGLEYKFVLQPGAMMLYEWVASTPVEYEFHGEREGDASGAFESYDKKSADTASGSFTAPFKGTHGWYWKNTTVYPITIRLTTAGFYEVRGLIGAAATRPTKSQQP